MTANCINNEEWKRMIERKFRPFRDKKALLNEVIHQYSKRALRHPRLVGRYSITPNTLSVINVRKFVSRYTP